MATTSPIERQFHRAVDVVQSLPKSGPVQTSYEEKLLLYSLYKQATEGDIAAPRPGMLDMLGRAKWDSWNKQKGVDKDSAKTRYVGELIKIFERFADRNQDAQRSLDELEAMGPIAMNRPSSPASSDSSFHSSRASPMEDRNVDDTDGPQRPQGPGHTHFPPPDPSLPPPDVAPNIIPPSALNASHRSLVMPQQQSQYGGGSDAQAHVPYVPPPATYSGPFAPPGGSRPQSLFGGIAGSAPDQRDPLAHLRSMRRQGGSGTPSLAFVPESGPTPLMTHHQHPQHHRPPLPYARDFAATPENPQLPGHFSGPPYMPNPSPIPLYGQRPASASTFSHAPLNLPATLSQIQTSLQALHERLTALERSQATLLRRREQKSHWFWTSSDEDELDDAELAADRERWDYAPSTTMRVRKRKALSARFIFALFTALRRAILGVGATVIVATIAIMLMRSPWRNNARRLWLRLRLRLVRLLTDQ